MLVMIAAIMGGAVLRVERLASSFCTARVKMISAPVPLHLTTRLVDLFWISAVKIFGVVLVSPQEFAPANTAETGSVFQEPSLFPKWQSSQCLFAGLPVY
jgi:hypothetical protein